ncbi:MAG: TIGR02281 family clan AA aspartic protease, partial [Alphaproteobacteria bacterium]|nr:TIGR02281 family clan AA aspartic protease [Alphaproteobacteria bacterium]
MLLVLALGGLAALALGDTGTLGGFDGGTIVALVASVALLIFIAGPFLSGRRGSLAKGTRDLLLWVGIMLLLVLGYSFRDEAQIIYQRIAGELLPPGHTLSMTEDGTGQQAVRIRRQPNGHFAARAAVNGQPMSLLVDTGASSIVLKTSDARAAGINIDTLNYRIPVRTANGLAYAASTRISSIAVGSIIMYNLDVMVAKPGAL